MKAHLPNSELPKGEKSVIFSAGQRFFKCFFVFELLKSSFVWKYQTWHFWYKNMELTFITFTDHDAERESK